MIIKNSEILNDSFEFIKEDIIIEDNKIAKIGNTNKAGEDFSDCIVIPGLIDIHTHGAMGYDSIDEDPMAVDIISDYMLKNGSTGYLPTFDTRSLDTYIKACENIKIHKKAEKIGSRILGIHMEGPFFSEKYKGAQNENYLKNPSKDFFDSVNEASGGIVKLISLAPELEGAMEFIKQMSDKVRISIGHTDADYEQADEAIKNGAKHMTHTYNAMRGLHHRNPNALGAAIDSSITMECISDGRHVHPAMVRLLYKAVGAQRLIFISDSIRACGMPDGEYMFGGKKSFMKNGLATLADGTIAGGSTPLLECVKCAVRFGIPLNYAVKCASYNPSKAIGMSETLGSIKEGKLADLLVLDKQLNLKKVMQDGKWIDLEGNN